MHNSNKVLAFAVLFFISGSVNYCQPHEGLSDQKILKENLTKLASDEFMGRETTSRGEEMSAEFIAEKLSDYGVKPFGDDNTFFQYFYVNVNGYEYETDFTFTTENGDVTKLNFNGDYIIYSPAFLPLKFSADNQEIIFAGFGIKADEYNYNDYDNIDVEGKIALVITGEPASNDDDYFEGGYRTHYSDIKYKIQTAEEFGAKAVICLPDYEEMQTFRYKQRSVTALNFSLEKESFDYEKEFDIPCFLLNQEGAKKILLNKINSITQGYDLHVVKRIFDRLEKPVLASCNYKIRIIDEVRIARNIIGLIEGNDPLVADQYVAVGAHYDHEGIQSGQIFNGADDNASGTVAVMEAARLFALHKNNRRPVLFILHTGEERGLLGSKYLTANSGFVENIISYINLDMIGRGDENSIFSIGSDRLSLEFHQLIERVNARTVKMVLDYKFDLLGDPNRYYYRSDHYSYAKNGIPIVFFYDNMTEDYHKPSDDSHKINYEKTAKITDLVYHVLMETANLESKLIID